MTYTRAPIPFERTFVIDSMALGESKHMIHGLIEADVTEARRQVRASERDVSWTAFIVACVARAVAAHPRVHAIASLRGDLVIFDAVDVCTIVEISLGDRTYPMPVVLKGADQRDVLDLTREIRAAQHAPRAKGTNPNRRLYKLMARIPSALRRAFLRLAFGFPTFMVPYTGSTMVTSVGMFGKGSGFGIATATLYTTNLVVGGLVERPRYVDDAVEPGTYQQLTVSFDHDVVDGGPAARFTAELVAHLEGAALLDALP